MHINLIMILSMYLSSNGNRLSMTSTTQTAAGMASASTTTTAVAAAPQYVAELSEFQTVVADIPPLVRINLSKRYMYG